MARSILAMVVGVLASNAVMFAAGVTWQMLRLFPNPPTGAALTSGQQLLVICTSLAGGILGGIAAGVMARYAEFIHAAALAGILFFFALGETHRQWIRPNGEPHWFLVVLILAAPLGAVIGGLIQQARAARGPSQGVE